MCNCNQRSTIEYVTITFIHIVCDNGGSIFFQEKQEFVPDSMIDAVSILAFDALYSTVTCVYCKI